MSTMPPMTPEMLAKTPSMMPPPGVEPNFVDPPSASGWATAVVTLFLALMLLILGMRLYCRFIIVKSVGIDDWAALAAGVCFYELSNSLNSCLHAVVLNQGGFGPHSWNVPLSAVMKPSFNQATITPNLFVTQLLVPVASGLAKVAILLFIIRIFPRVAAPKIAYCIYFGLILNCLFYVTLFIYTVVMCAPRPDANGQLPLKCDGHLRMTLGVACASINAVLDIYVLCVAIPAIWSLQMPMKRKIGVVLILCTGTASCACSIVALYLRVALGNEDPSRRQVLPLVITILEPLIGIITACLPALPSLWVQVSTKVATSIRSFLSRRSDGSTNFSQSGSSYEPRSQSPYSSTKSLNKDGVTVLSQVEMGIRGDTHPTVTGDAIRGKEGI
ncbi:hypothetical protein AOQ84DRAFT_423185 [Glonium stellatum]|uniref:Rhodopsin domain-containing protein n=1 Tax=Glonium stellatum TaxID=574774 RepID=A0A8E2FDP1_9PEZI|nr:hypothetical protein AOQ84DRAFT_423185 [Glonium stellatum]